MLLAALAATIMMGASCDKGNDPVVPPTPPVGPAKPTNLTYKADTALNGEKAFITFKSNDANTLVINGVDYPMVAGTYADSLGPFKKDSTLNVLAVNVDTHGKRSDVYTPTSPITVKVWSLNLTRMHKYGTVVNTVTRSCIEGKQSSTNPTDWINWSLDCNLYWFHSNGTSTGKIGPCNPNAGTLTSGKWEFSNVSETQIRFSGYDIWNIAFLPDGFIRFRVEDGRYLEQKFTTKKE